MGAVWDNGGRGCTGFVGNLRCDAKWISEGAGVPDYLRGLRNDPTKVVAGTAMDIVGVGLFYGGIKVIRLCLRQSEEIHKPHCFIGVDGLGGRRAPE
jgi:hypothetical protein